MSKATNHRPRGGGMILAHSMPCGQCPFRRKSAPGWLGAASPEEFIGATLAEADMPCHAMIDYEAEDWRERAETGPRCAGSLVFLKNCFHLPRDPALRSARDAVAADRVSVFARRSEFLEHHGTGGDGP